MKNLIKKIQNSDGELESASSRIKEYCKAYQSSLDQIKKNITESYEKLPNSVLKLAAHGWYTSMDMTPKETHSLAHMIIQGNHDEVDKQMIEFLENNIGQIEQSLKDLYPKRANILNVAFRNHHEKNYFSSIPLFLTQADGICFDFTEKRIYSTHNKGVPKIAELINELDSEDISTILLQPLKKQGLITATEFHRGSFSGNINRHDILHGISVDYGTKLNSYKAISWLTYISEILGGTVENRE